MRAAPNCRYCQKKLRKKTYGTHTLPGEPEPMKVWPGEKYERAIIQIVSKKPDTLYRDGRTNYSVWCGEWGSYGDNRFCGLRCGYEWALDNCRGANGVPATHGTNRTTKPPRTP